MYTLISSGRVIGEVNQHKEFREACAAAKRESTVDGGCIRQGISGRIVSVWSGPIAPWIEGSEAVRGITKHASYACGAPF